MQQNIRLRHQIVKAMRDFFDSRGFLEIETPMLIKSTPEGARDYLVPSRLYPGNFYALPQSPQLLKQILMIAGFGRYMQIARCMRDEDPRADRLVEFVQLDVELSFCTQEEVLETMESCMRYVWRTVLGIELPSFPRLTHQEALAKYGLDKPDLRFGLELADATAIFAGTDFDGLSIRDRSRAAPSSRFAIRAARRYRAEISTRLTETAKEFGSEGHGLDCAWRRGGEVFGRAFLNRRANRERPPGVGRARRATHSCSLPTRASSRTRLPERCATRSATVANCAIRMHSRSRG